MAVRLDLRRRAGLAEAILDAHPADEDRVLLRRELRHDPAQAALAGQVIDCLQIPAFLCRQTDLLLAAQAYEKAGQGPRARDIFLLFADKFPDHERTPSVVLELGDRALRVTNYVDAAPMYQRVVEKYNKAGTIYNDALNRLASCQAGLNDYTNAIQTLKIYFGAMPNGAEKINALMRIAARPEAAE